MNEPILVVDRDRRYGQALCDAIQKKGYAARTVASLKELETVLDRSSVQAVILNLDTLHVDNQIIKDMKQRHPEIEIVILSGRSYHPELEEAMAQYIYGCLGVPVDTDELFYCLKGIAEKGIPVKPGVS